MLKDLLSKSTWKHNKYLLSQVQSKHSHGLLPADIHVRFNSKLGEEKAHRRLFLQTKSLGNVAHLHMALLKCVLRKQHDPQKSNWSSWKRSGGRYLPYSWCCDSAPLPRQCVWATHHQPSQLTQCPSERTTHTYFSNGLGQPTTNTPNYAMSR